MKQVCKGYSGKVGIMDTIKNYLENLFCNVGVNEEVLRLKQDLYNNMEEKYMELKREGHSENEAIGMVISNFGNIDELLKELGVEKPAAKKGRFLSQTEVEDLVYNQKRWSKFIGIGVFLILAAVAVLILSGVVLEKVELFNIRSMSVNINELSSALPLIPFFILLAAGIGTLIISGLMLEKYEFIEKEEVEISTSTRNWVEKRKESYQLSYVILIVAGVMLCVLSPMVLITIATFTGTDLGGAIGVASLLIMIGIAVYLFVVSGMEMETYQRLLKVGEFSPERKKENKVVSIVAAIVWPLTVVAFLAWSFLGNDWHISWILFPIVGILFGAFAGVVELIQKN